MQNNQNISKALFGIGTALCVAAFIWWAKFYEDIAEFLNDDLDTYLQCLINPGGDCAQASYWAQQFGATPYSPYLFWAGILFLVIGFVINKSSKTSE